MFLSIVVCSRYVFCCYETATPEIYPYLHTPTLHDALPIVGLAFVQSACKVVAAGRHRTRLAAAVNEVMDRAGPGGLAPAAPGLLGRISHHGNDSTVDRKSVV